MYRRNFLLRIFNIIVYYICASLSLVLSIYFNVNFIVSLLCYVLMCFAVTYYEIKIRDPFRYMQILIEEDCDPQSIIDEIDKILKHRILLNKKRMKRKNKQISLLIRIICLINLGEYQNANNELTYININILLKHSKWAIRFYLALSEIELENNDIEKAKKYLNEALSIVKSNKRKIQDNLNEIALIKAKMRIKESDYIKAEKCLNGIGEDCTTLESIKKSYLLALVYIQNRRTIDANKKLSYVIETGNNLCYVQQARQLQESMASKT